MRKTLTNLEIKHLQRLCKQHGVDTAIIDTSLTYWENYKIILQHSTKRIGDIEALVQKAYIKNLKKNHKNKTVIPFVPPHHNRHPTKSWLTKGEVKLLEQLRLPLRRKGLPIYSFQN